MEKPYTGLTAMVKLNGEKIGYINNVELSLEKDIVEILQFGAQYREKVPTIKNWTASADGTIAFEAGGSQEKLYLAFESGESVTLTTQLDAGVYFEGEALVASLNISGAPDTAMDISAEFEGNGGITLELPETVTVSIRSGNGGSTDPAGVMRVAKNGSLTVNCSPAAGKVADKYYIDDDTSGTAITSNTFTLASISTDKIVTVKFKDVT